MRASGAAVYLVGVVLPLAATTLIALRYALGGFTDDGFTLNHFAAALDVRFLRSVGYTVAIAASSTLAALWLALGVVRAFGAVRALQGWMLIPLTLSPVVVAFFVYQFLSGSGVVSRIAHSVGLIDDSLEFVALVNDPWGVGTALAHFMLVFPALVLYLVYLRSRPEVEALETLGQSLGASANDRWKRIVRPVVVQRSLPLVMVFFIFTLGSYEVANLLGAQRIQAVVPFIADRISGYNLAEVPQGYALALVYTCFIAAVMAFVSKRMWHG